MKFKNINLIIPLLCISLKVIAGPVNNKNIDLSSSNESDDEIYSLGEELDLNDDGVKIVDIFSDDENIATEIIDINDEKNITTGIMDIDEEECSSEECIQTSKRILSYMDISVDPCDDFFQFSCGGWKSDKLNLNDNNILKIVSNEIHDIFESEYTPNENLSKEDQIYDEKTFKKLMNTYSVCMNNEINESYPNEHLINFIKKLNISENKENLKDPEALTNLLVKLQINGIHSFISLYVNEEYDILDRPVVGTLFSQNRIIHSDVFKLAEIRPDAITIYKDYIKTIITNILGDIPNIDSVIDSIISSERKFDELKMETFKMEMKGETHPEILKLKELNGRYSFINWNSYINNIFGFFNLSEYINDDMMIYNRYPIYIEEIQKLINEMTADDIAIYLEWNTIAQIMDYYNDYISGDIAEAKNKLDEEINKLLMTLSPEETNKVLGVSDMGNSIDPKILEEMMANLSPEEINEMLAALGLGYNSTNPMIPGENSMIPGENTVIPGENNVIPGTDTINLNLINANRKVKRDEKDITKEEIKENGKKEEDKHKECLSHINSIMPMAVSKYFIERNINNNVKSEVKVMVENIKKAMMNRIQKIEWLDDATKNYAIEKVSKIKERIGYPDDIMEPKKLYQRYENLEINNIFDFIMKIKIYENFGNALKYIGSNEWRMPPHYPSAYIDWETNSINLPVALLQNPLYDSNNPDYINYGSYGMIIGHELTHAFDNIGKNYDAEGHFNNWWTDNDNKEFEEYSQCFIDEYNSFTYKDDVSNKEFNVNGKSTLGENLADNGGLARAYDAWQLSLLNNPEKSAERNKRLPGFENYTVDQLLYISYAQYFCKSLDSSYDKGDAHSPGFARVNGVVSNSKHFAETFNCPINKPMNPENKCIIW